MGIQVTETTAYCNRCGSGVSTHSRVCRTCGHSVDNYCCNCTHYSNGKDTCSYGVNVYSDKPACPGFKYHGYTK